MNRIWGKAIQTDAKVSPANYGGPLVDIAGRVQGVLVPASPRAAGETAGLEWYDSGIGFAMPLEDINAVLPRLREGRDLKPGILGIQMQGGDMAPPNVAAIAHDSAAAKAGIKAGDLITAIDGHKVQNQAQLRHQLGNKYEGDAVAVELKRGKENLKLEKITLTGAPDRRRHSLARHPADARRPRRGRGSPLRFPGRPRRQGRPEGGRPDQEDRRRRTRCEPSTAARN